MDLKGFRDKIRHYRRATGNSQEALAQAVGLYPTVLSAKLNGKAVITHPEIKRIVQILVEWEALTQADEVTELLALVGLKLTHAELQTLKLAPSVVATLTKPTSMPDLVVEDKPRYTYLPAQTTLLIGREQEVEKAGGLLRRADVRLLNLVGTGGIGKTRLALQIAAELQDDFDGGVIFIFLETFQEASQVIAALYKQLGLKENNPQDLLESLIQNLRQQRLLLVLDNFEQLNKESSLITNLLETCPYLKILVTSRVILNLYGEYQYSVPPLGLPPITPHNFEELAHFEAIQLFIQRARATNPDFLLTSENSPIISQICHLLEGIPLAIELAAAQSKSLTPAQLWADLQNQANQLNVLAGRIKKKTDRQQTMRNTIEWSYNLLDESEQRLFEELSIFRGSFEAIAVQKICNRSDTLEMLISLQAKSIIKPSDEQRYTLLVTMQQYAHEKLLTKPAQFEQLKARYLDYYYKLALEISPKLSESYWLAYLEKEYGNFRQSLEWAVAKENLLYGTGLGLVNALWWFWYLRGHFSEGRYWLEIVLSKTDEKQVEPSLLASLFNAAGALASTQGEHNVAKQFYEKALAIKQTLQDKVGMAKLLINLSALANNDGDYGQARTLTEQGLALWREVGNQAGLATALNSLGMILRKQGELPQAAQYHQASLALRREIGDKRGIAYSLGGLGQASYYQGDYGLAQKCFEESLELAKELGDRDTVANSYGNLGIVAYLQANLADAQSFYEKALAIQQEIGSNFGASESMFNLAQIALEQSNYRAAYDYLLQSLKLRLHAKNKLDIAECLAGLACLSQIYGRPHDATALITGAYQVSQAAEPNTFRQSYLYQYKLIQKLGLIPNPDQHFSIEYLFELCTTNHVE